MQVAYIPVMAHVFFLHIIVDGKTAPNAAAIAVVLWTVRFAGTGPRC